MLKNAFCGWLFRVSNRRITKTLLVMKLTIVLLSVAILNVSATGISQTITLSGKDIPLEKIFSEVKAQTGFIFLYTDNSLIGTKPVSVNVNQVSLEEFLKLILKEQPVKYTIENKTILLSRKELEKVLNSTGEALAPPGSIQGRVTNEDGKALAGANIVVKGTSNQGTSTDEKGEYKMENIAPGVYTLQISYVGYNSITRSIKVLSGATVSINFQLELNPYGFNDIVISANLVASKKKEISSAVTTITSKQIEQLQINNITQLFRGGEVAGATSWNTGPANVSGIKLRGDVDFYSAGGTVKIFIDGIEIANPSSLAIIPVNSIDHIEILHGPQASTLYGSGATSGVIYIFTKKGKAGGPHINAKVSAGTIASEYVNKTVYQQDHSLNISGGNEGISYSFGGSYFHYDPYWPDGNSTNTNAFGSTKAKQGNFTAELTGQYSTRKFGAPLNPILKDSFSTIPDNTSPYNLSTNQFQQTLGLNIGYTAFSWWQHNLSIGIDQNNSTTVRTSPRFIDPYDTLNFKQYYDQSKKSYRYYTTLKIPTGNFLKTTITAGFDHNMYEYSSMYIQGTGTDPNFAIVGTPFINYQKYSNTGYYAQGVFGFADKFFLTAGVRSESTKQFGNSSGSSVAPKVGGSFVLNLGNIMIKPRAGYGKSIKVPNPANLIEITTPYPQYGFTYHQLASPGLKPQEQTGYDVGFDMEFGNGLGTLEATYYNQLVSNFITSIFDYSNYPPIIEFQYVNVGEIRNTGLELAGTLNINPIKFRFTYSITNSKISDIASTGYENMYQNGDRIWGIPKSNGGATITYSFPSLFKSSTSTGGSIDLGVSYVGSWISRDEVSLYRDYNVLFDYSKGQRSYGINYSSYALFRLGANYNISKNVEVFLNINNLFNSQKFENDNITPTQGRITMLGLRINY